MSCVQNLVLAWQRVSRTRKGKDVPISSHHAWKYVYISIDWYQTVETKSQIRIPRQAHIYEPRKKPSWEDIVNMRIHMTAYWFHGSSKLQSPNRCTSQQWCEIEISIGRNDNNIWSKDSCSHRRFLESQKTHTHTHHIALCQSPEVTHNHPIRNQVLLHAVFGWRPLSSSCGQPWSWNSFFPLLS